MQFLHLHVTFILCLVVTTYAQQNYLSPKCTTPDRQQGNCIRLRDCSLMWNLLESVKPTKDHNNGMKDTALNLTVKLSLQRTRMRIMDYIHRSQCKHLSNNERTYCCPAQKNNQPTTQKTTSSNSIVNIVENHPNKKLVFGECGNMGAFDMIAGGTEAVMGHYPWLVRLEYATSRGPAVLCAGVLISKRYVLTSAVCLKSLSSSRLRYVHLGEHNVTSDPDCVPTRTGDYCADPMLKVGVEAIIPHPQYSPKQNRQADIGLVRLSQNINNTDYIKSICLPRGQHLLSKFEGTSQILAGWGTTDSGKRSEVKLQATLPVVNNAECQRIYPQLNLTQSQMCAGGQQGVDSCAEDSGGPLMSVDDTEWYVTGIVSMGPARCGTRGQPGIYTRVNPYVPWILDNISP